MNHSRQAFTRTDVLTSVLVVLLLAGISVATTRYFAKKHSDITCADNLQFLGHALSMYAEDNSDRLPTGAINFNDKKFVTWDGLLTAAVLGDLKQKNGFATTGDAGRIFSCPKDVIPRIKWSAYQRKRTYSMPLHNMKEENWPPGKNNATGVGLNWSWYSKGLAAVTNLNGSKTNPAYVSKAMILQPSFTMVLTEQASNPKSFVGNSAGALIATTSAHLDVKIIDSMQYHGGSYYYLFMDGSVQLLEPSKTTGLSGAVGNDPAKHKGMWTIKADD